MDTAKKILVSLWSAVRAHTVVTTLFLLGALTWLAFCLMIGMWAPAIVGLPVLVVAVGWGLHRWWYRRAADASGTRIGVMAVVSAAVATVIVFGVIQAIPYGRNHTNPAPTGEPKWANAETRDILVAACYDCHSDRVKYPGYASIAPISWTVQNHVEEGRSKVNFSEFATNRRGFDDVIEVIRDGSMPPGYFTAFGRHPQAKLTPRQIDTVIAGLQQTPGFGNGG